MEIEKDGLNGEEPYSCCNKVSDLPVSSICDSDREASSNGGTNPRFGIRRGHYFYIVKARARSFLYHQVRLLVGVLKCVGAGELTVKDAESILNAKSVTAAPPMAPAYGLYLGHVKYDLP
uniref:tRNA pseudouridine synthase n=1 Tax=Rhizophora mucronata TaxID=61149 RepID=A0A2P2KZF5_RHIMU